MKSEWQIRKLCDIVEFNPSERLPKGSMAKKVSMDMLKPFTKNILQYELQLYNGGAKFRNGDTIMARITPCLENGKTSKIDFLDDGEVGFGSTEYIVLRAIPEISDPDYIYYLATSALVREPAIKSMVGSSGRQRVQQSVLEALELPVPFYDEQQRIASNLSALDEKIAINQAINDNLMQQAVTIFKSWFVEYSPFDGIEPKEWETVNLEKITSLISRRIAPKYSDNSDQIVINQKCIRNHMIDLSQARTHTPKVINEKWLRFGDLLINSTGDGTLGRAAQVWFQPQNITVDSHVTVVRPAKENLIFYIGLWGVLHEREIESLHTGSTGQTELPKERVKALELHLPDNGTLDRFNTLIAPMAAAIISKQNENNKLATLRDALLPKLMSGEIDVSAVQL